MNSKKYSDRDFQMCLDLLEYLEDEMEYRMCSKVSSHTNNFHKEFPQRGDTTLTNIIVSIKRVGVEKMKSDVSQFLKYYMKYQQNQSKWSGELVG
tara:strand:+ start:9009 stop:9293 length:285 start_codon:yes stop_codon:yes gene_type:complete